MQLALREVATILGSTTSKPAAFASGYSIDSRTLRRGDLFIALRGIRVDGHEFVTHALERGAVAAVVDKEALGRLSPATLPAVIPVANPAKALQDLAQAVRQRWGRKVVAVTGSTGKTTTKELITALLSTEMSVHKSVGNLNNQFGLPLSLLALEPSHHVAVLELGMSAPGEIAHLARLASPQIGVVTNVAEAHLEFFDSVDGIAAAKRELVENLQAPATAVLNYDDIRVRAFSDGFTGSVVTFGFADGADFRCVDFRVADLDLDPASGSLFRVKGNTCSDTLYLPLPGLHNVENALAAIATASVLGISPDRVLPALFEFRTLVQRNEVMTLANGSTLINDSYNSNPRAMERMLDTLAHWPRAGRRIVVAGEMLELGHSSPELHRAVGRRCLENGVDWLLAVQGDAQFLAAGAIEGGLPMARVKFFATAAEAAVFCQDMLRPEDIILVKGSRGVHLETVVEVLRSLRTTGSMPLTMPAPHTEVGRPNAAGTPEGRNVRAREQGGKARKNVPLRKNRGKRLDS